MGARFCILLGLILALWVGTSMAQTCDHYADPAGTGTVCTQVQPCQPVNLWGVLTAGEFACFNDGTYTGFNNMVQPTIDGTSGNPITLRCVNEGQCIFDGQVLREPFDFTDRAYFVVEGVDAHSSDLAVFNLTRADNIVFRRTIGYDGNPAEVNGNIFAYADATNLTFEDTAGFGTARKIYAGIRSADVIHIRSAARCEGSDVPNDINCLETGRDMEVRHLVLNSIVTAWEHPVSGDPGQQILGLFGVGSTPSGSPLYLFNHQLKGNIGYVLNGRWPNAKGPQACSRQLLNDGVAYTNHACYMPPDQSTRLGIWIRNETDPHVATSITGSQTRGGGGNSFDGDITTSNVEECLENGSNCTSIYDGPNVQICKRYDSTGTLTNDALWPWPMNDRILAATLRDDPARGWDINAEIQALYGTFPVACTTSTPSATSTLHNGRWTNGALQ